MKLDNFKNSVLDENHLDAVLGGTDIFGEDTGFIIEDDILVVDIIEEEGDF